MHQLIAFLGLIGKKRHRKFFRTRIDAFSFRNQKELELGIKDRVAIENEVIFMVLSEIKDKLSGLDERISRMEESLLDQQESMREIRKPPAPKNPQNYRGCQSFCVSQEESSITCSIKKYSKNTNCLTRVLLLLNSTKLKRLWVLQILMICCTDSFSFWAR